MTNNNYLGPDGQWNTWDEYYGGYQFISIDDIINNFIIAYVGEDKIISKIKRSDVHYSTQCVVYKSLIMIPYPLLNHRK